MIMDGIKKRETEKKPVEIKEETPEKFPLWHLPLKHKLATLVALLSLTSFMLPHQAYAWAFPPSTSGAMVFVLGQKIAYLDTLNLELSKIYEHSKMQEELDHQLEL